MKPELHVPAPSSYRPISKLDMCVDCIGSTTWDTCCSKWQDLPFINTGLLVLLLQRFPPWVSRPHKGTGSSSWASFGMTLSETCWTCLSSSIWMTSSSSLLMKKKKKTHPSSSPDSPVPPQHLALCQGWKVSEFHVSSVAFLGFILDPMDPTEVTAATTPTVHSGSRFLTCRHWGGPLSVVSRG